MPAEETTEINILTAPGVAEKRNTIGATSQQSGGNALAGERSAYVHAVRFNRDAAAKRVYTQIQEALRHTECDVSVYNLRVNGEPIVVVVGEPPPKELHERVQRYLRAGAPTTLPHEVTDMLIERSIEARGRAPWSEGHYGSGKRLS